MQIVKNDHADHSPHEYPVSFQRPAHSLVAGLKSSINNHLDGKKILPLFILTNSVYSIMLIVTIPGVMRFAGGMKLPDMLPTGYDAAYVNALMSALGTAGREAYLWHQLPLDMVYPGLFGITYCLLLVYILKKLQRSEGYLFNLCLLPLLGGFFDYCENFGIISILNTYPHNPAFLTDITSLFSILKSSFTTVFFLVLIILLIALAMKKLLPPVSTK